MMKGRLSAASSEDKKTIQKILTKWRRKQRKMDPSFGSDDPHPYEYTYVFYCLEDGAGVDK